MTVFNFKDKSKQVMAFLDKYLPDLAEIEIQLKKYEKCFKTADAKQKALEKKNDELTAALEKSEKQSTLKKLQEAKLQRDYADACAILDRIPPEILRENYGDSVSIEPQRTILQQYAKDNGLHVISEYIDDGWSGTNFERPSFKRMIRRLHGFRLIVLA